MSNFTAEKYNIPFNGSDVKSKFWTYEFYKLSNNNTLDIKRKHNNSSRMLYRINLQRFSLLS